MNLQRFDVVMTPDGPGVLIAEWEDGGYEVEFETDLKKLDGRTYPREAVTFLVRPTFTDRIRCLPWPLDKVKDIFPTPNP